MKSKSLEGKGILITRPRLQAAHLASEIESRSGRVILCPAIDLIELPDKAVNSVTTYDAIIFVSPTSVEIGWKKVKHLIEDSRTVSIAAAGPATANKVLKEGSNVLFPDGQGGARALIEVLRSQLDLSTSNVLVVNGEGGDRSLEKLLQYEGAKVQTFACYRRLDIRDSRQLENSNQLASGLDAWIITSRRSIGNILAQFEGQEIKLTAIPLFVNHSAIADEAFIRGVRTVFVCQDAGNEMIRSIEDWFVSSKLDY
ncbi:uroporphyrinogen-III synthase [Burkholderiales bacterium]|nr:uroporphyrinogen-III synthase [Burkholderiales bacterium]